MHLFGRPRKAAGTCKCEKDSKINKVVVHGYRVRQQKIEAYRNTPLFEKLFLPRTEVPDCKHSMKLSSKRFASA